MKSIVRLICARSRTSRYFVSWAAAFSSGVFGVGVLVGRLRETRARFGLRDVEDVLAWLEAAR